MNRVASIALAPLSGIYEALVRSGNTLYSRDFFRVHNVGKPVISVGNLTTGGTGKTPLVEWLARELAYLDRRVCILTRGYRRESKGRVLVSNGQEILADVTQAGDEALLLAENLKERAAVVCDADRVAAAQWASENLKSDVFLLDDGFQHQRIARDLNIVTIDATNPWGNGMLLPAGILREPRSALARADCAVVTRAEDPAQAERIQTEIQALAPEVAILLSRMTIKGWQPVNDSARLTSTDGLKNLRAAAFCGIGNPESFFSLLRGHEFDLRFTRALRDHFSYAQTDLYRIAEAARTHDAQVLLTTSKDAVKLRSLNISLPCYAVEIQIEIAQPETLRRLIFKAIGTSA